MGKLSLMLVIAAFFTSGLLVYQANTTTLNAEGRVWEHQYGVLARDVASTGMNSSMRVLTHALATNTTWSPALVERSNVAHEGGTFTVEAFSDQCSILTNARLTSLRAPYTGASLLEVQSTGTYAAPIGANATHSHRLTGCYLQADYDLFKPPAFQYGFISHGDFTFNGGPTITSLDGEGNVHSNKQMTLGPQVEIKGHATYYQTGGTNRSTKVSSYEQGLEVPMTQFDPNVFRSQNGLPTLGSASTTGTTTGGATFRYDAGPLTLSSNSQITIGYNPMPADRGSSKPFVWFIDGDLTINADLKLPGYTIIMATGKVTFSGQSEATVTGTTPANNATPAQLKTWVESQLINGHPPLAWYAGGDVKINGTPNVVGNFMTNGNFELDGGGSGGNLVGSVSAYGNITANGGGSGNNFWFVEIGDQTVIPGVMLPGKQIVRLALAEWTGPLIP